MRLKSTKICNRIRSMNKGEFSKIRRQINKTQKELALLLGISKKTVESYEQGFRNIPVNTERILYYIFFKLNIDKFDQKKVCWDEKDCPASIRNECIAWITKEGFFCWFLTGNSCRREMTNPSSSNQNCFQCSFFRNKLNKIETRLKQ